MPIYEYACGRCGRRVEVVHGVHAHGPAACESCGGPLRKLLSTPAIHFRGTGWAKKDAREAASRPSGKGTGAGTPVERKGAGERSSAGAGTDATGPTAGED